jgi:lipopolysaccharide biosynthesis glycosyltransferase
MLIQKDVKELFDIDVGDNYIGATRDLAFVSNRNNSIWAISVLGVQPENYFNAGCMICNLAKMRKDSLTEKLIDKLIEIKNPKYVEQCIMNAVCKDRVKYISNNWNFTWHLPLYCKDYLATLPSPYKERYVNAQNDPYIIHFTAAKKPWQYPSLAKSDQWWQYARMTPFYEEILFKNTARNTINAIPIKDCFDYKNNCVKYNFYTLLSKITFGKGREKYQRKLSRLKEKIERAEQFLR